MLDDIRNTAGDLLSGKMKDERIALTKQESDLLRLKVEGLMEKVRTFEEERVTLIRELEKLRLKVADQTALIADLESKLQERDRVIDRLDQPTAEVLKLLFDHADGLTLDTMCAKTGFKVSEAEFHLGELIELEFIGFDEGTVGFGHTDGWGQSHYTPGAPETYFIEQKGRAYIMKNG